MNDFLHLREQALTDRQEGRYEQALPVYRTLWEAHRDDCNEWDAWGYAYCLRQCGRHGEALDVCRAAYRQWPDFGLLRTLYAWCIYRTAFTPDAGTPELLRAGRAIIRLCQTGDPYAPYDRAVVRLMEHLLSLQPSRGAAALAWAALLDPVVLPDEPRLISDAQGRPLELASLRERYLAACIKACYLEGRWEDCVTWSEKALDQLDRLHYDNDLWFRRYAALAAARLQRFDVALDLIGYVLARRRAWFVLQDVAGICAAAGRPDEAMAYALEAALQPGPPGMKVRLYAELAEHLAAADFFKAARQVVELACAVRRDRGWQPDGRLLVLAGAIEADPDTEIPLRKLRQRSERSLARLRFAMGPASTGTIEKLLPGGRAGFLRDESGRTFYFACSAFLGDSPAAGLAVEWIAGQAYNPKKGLTAETAVLLRPLPGKDGRDRSAAKVDRRTGKRSKNRSDILNSDESGTTGGRGS